MSEIHVVAHCLLNPLTRVKGLGPVASRPGDPLIQLPCPEAVYLGMDRWAVTSNQLDYPAFRRFCQELLRHQVDLIEMLAMEGVRVVVVGVAGSPSCGVRTTTSGYKGGMVRKEEHSHVPGMGVFMEELARELARRGVTVEWDEVGEEAGL